MERKTLLTDKLNNNECVTCVFRNDGFRELYELGYMNKKNVDGPREFHSHPGCVEITYHISGRQIYTVETSPGETEDFLVSGGEVFVTYPGEKHGSGQYFEDVSKFYWLTVRVDCDPEDYLHLNADEGAYLISRFLELHPRHKKASPEIRRGLNRIIKNYREGPCDPLDKSLIQTTVFNIFYELLHSPDIIPGKEAGEISVIKDYIDKNIEHNFDISSLSRRCYLSESHFKHKFKQTFGIPPTEYVTRKKVERAKELLITTDMSITEIAMQLGFCSCSYFNKTFKRYAWCTPRRFRATESKKPVEGED